MSPLRLLRGAGAAFPHLASPPPDRTGHEGGFVRLWRTSDWSDVLTFRVHKKAAINDVAPHPTARVALSVGRDRSLRLIDLTKGKVVAVQDMGGREPREVRYSPDGSAFAVLFDSEVVVHDAATAEPRTRVSLPDAVVKFVSFAFVPLRGGGGGGSGGGDSCCLAIGCEGGALLLASPRDGAPLALHQTGHAGRVRCVAATAAAADALVFTLGADAVVHVWQAAALLAAATPAAPLQRLLAAKGFRGTCLTLVEAPAPSRPAPHGGAAAAGEAAVAGPASSGGGAAVPPGKKKVGGAQQRPSAAGSSDAAPAGGAAGGGAAAAAAAAGGGAAPKDAPPPHAASGAGGKRPEKRKRQVAFAPTE